MLIIKRAQKSETIIELLQSYYAEITQSVGLFDEKQGVSLAHSLLDTALFNVVCGEKEPSNVLNVAALLENAKSQQQPFLWLHHDSNIHLHQYLKNQHLESRASIHGYCFPLESTLLSFDAHPAVEMSEVASEEQFYEWCHTFSVCHGISVDLVEQYFRSGIGENRVFQLFSAQLYQKTIACCAMYRKEKNAILLWDSVLPMYRRQGVGSMMVLSRLKLAKAEGLDEVFTFGANDRMQLLKKLGFKSFGKFRVLYYEPSDQEKSEAESQVLAEAPEAHSDLKSDKRQDANG